jgi:AraC-like DNA-binding protein
VQFHLAQGAERLISTLRTTGAAVVLVPSGFGEGAAGDGPAERAAAESVIAELRARAPQLLVVVMHTRGEGVSDLRQVQADTALLDLTSEDAASRLSGLAQRASRRARLAGAAAAMASGAPESAAWLLRQFVERAFDPLRLEPWTQRLPISRATANRRVRQAYGTSLEPALRWGRLLAAAVELEHTLRRVVDVAYDLGFEDATGLTQTARGLMGCGMRELLREGGSALVLQRWHSRSSWPSALG